MRGKEAKLFLAFSLAVPIDVEVKTEDPLSPAHQRPSSRPSPLEEVIHST